MIEVDNSPKRRIFTNISSDEVADLKRRVVNKIIEIEEGSQDYNDLSMFENESCSDNISVFFYKKKIEEGIEILLSDNKIDKDFKDELRDLKRNLFKILVGDFPTIKKYLLDLKKKNSQLINQGISSSKSEDYKKYQERFSKLYETQLTKVFKKSFFKIFTEQGVNVCPYCNRNYISPIYKTEKVGNDYKKKSPDIEHFFPKSIYPLLALSISNLLPSCDFCNKIKSNVDTLDNCISPYEKAIENEFRFRFDLLDVSTRTIKLESSFNNSKILHLESLYAEVHHNFVDEVFWDIRKNPMQHQKFLESFGISSSKDEEYKKQFRNYFKEDDFNKQPLSKMTKDLFMQIKEDEE